MDVYHALVIAHVVGTVLGVGGATFAELYHMWALRIDSEVSENDEMLRGIYAVLRLGFFMLVLSGFGFLLYYRLTGATELIYSPYLWAKFTIIGVLAINSAYMLMQKGFLIWGSAIALTSWYMALALGVLRNVEYTYLNVMLIYALLVICMFFVISFVRHLLLKSVP